MKTTVTQALVNTEEFVSPKDHHMSATVLYTGLELTVKVRFHIRYKIASNCSQLDVTNGKGFDHSLLVSCH